MVLFLDACVLYPTQTRDLFMGLALRGLVRLKWSLQVQEEWIHRLLEHKPSVSSERLWLVAEKMAEALEFQEPLVEGYEDRINEVRPLLPDPRDAHVVAAAIHGGADAILTFNIKDFPETVLSRWDLVVLHPDDYLVDMMLDQIRSNFLPKPLLEVLKRQRLGLKNPPLNVDAFLTSLERAGLKKLAEALASYKQYL